MDSYQANPVKPGVTQMLTFSESLAYSLNNNVQTDVIYFDFAKAFDSINHDILLSKLKNEFCLDGRLLNFLVDYLSDRNSVSSLAVLNLTLAPLHLEYLKVPSWGLYFLFYSLMIWLIV